MADRPRVYLDNSALNRPFDDQSQPRIFLETQALISILGLVGLGDVELLISSVNRFENDQNPLRYRKQLVDQLLRLGRVEQRMDEIVHARALTLETEGVKPLDALHLAAAEVAGATHFLTCDDRLLKRYTGSASAMNPTQFVLVIHRGA